MDSIQGVNRGFLFGLALVENKSVLIKPRDLLQDLVHVPINVLDIQADYYLDQDSGFRVVRNPITVGDSAKLFSDHLVFGSVYTAIKDNFVTDLSMPVDLVTASKDFIVETEDITRLPHLFDWSVDLVVILADPELDAIFHFGTG